MGGIEEITGPIEFPRGRSSAWVPDRGRAQRNATEIAKRYADKSEGLSLHARLAQLDFSSDDDSPSIGCGTPKVSADVSQVSDFSAGTKRDDVAAKSGFLVEDD